MFDVNDNIISNDIVETTTNLDHSITVIKQPVQTLFKLEYDINGPVTNVNNIALIGSDVKYVLENDIYVAEYGTTKGSDNASINATIHQLKFTAPNDDFLIDISFKTPSNATAENHSLFAVTSDSDTKGFQVYTPDGVVGYQATTWPWDSTASIFNINQAIWTPPLNQYGRYTLIFRKSTNKLEVLINGSKDTQIDTQNWSSVSNNIVDIIDKIDFFGKEVTVHLGHGRDNAFTNGTTYLRISSFYVKTINIPKTPITTIDMIPNLLHEHNISTTNINQDGSSVEIITDDENNIISNTTTSAKTEDGDVTVLTTNSDNTYFETVTRSDKSSITINKDASGNILKTTETIVNHLGETTSIIVKDSSDTVIEKSIIIDNGYRLKSSSVILPETQVLQSTFPPKYTNTFWKTKTMYADGSDKLFWVNTYDNITYEIYGSSYRENEEPYRVFSRHLDNTTERIDMYETNYTPNNKDHIHAWHSDTSSWATITAIIKISKEINIQSYYFRARHYTSPTQRPSKWRIFVSNDSDTWTEIDNRDNEGGNYTLNSIRKFDTPSYQGYYKWIKIVVDNQDNTWWSQSDWRFDGTFADEYQETLTFLDYNDKEITYQSFPSKYTNDGWQSKTMYADGSDKLFWFNVYDNITYEIYGSSYRANEEPYRVLSRNVNIHSHYEQNVTSTNKIHAWHSDTDSWASITAIIKMSKRINIQSYYFRARSYNSPTQRPSKWRIFVSNDSDTWIEIDNRDNEGGNYLLNSIRKFDTPSYQGYYNWIKIIVDDQDNMWWSQSDWRFDGSTEILELSV